MLEKNKNVIRVLAIDGHPLIHFGLSMLINDEQDMELVGVSKSLTEGQSLAHRFSPDVILLELELIADAIDEKIQELVKICPSGKILIFTSNSNHDNHILALRSGAAGIQTKDQSNDLLLKAIRSVFSGEMWVNLAITARLLRNHNSGGKVSVIDPTMITNLLTPRESVIAGLAAQGLSSKKISSQLFLSEKTVRNQLSIIYSKLGVSS
jgi:DNA-binding NarL/FixJ family response regulator